MNDQQLIYSAYWEIGDYCSRLGGSAVNHTNFYESDIPLYLCLQLLQRGGFEILLDEYLSPGFVEAIEPVKIKVNCKLAQLSPVLDSNRVLTDVLEFFNVINSRYRDHHRSPGWLRLQRLIETEQLNRS